MTTSNIKKTGFLQRLVSLTEERDLEMLERSMLLTVCESLKPRETVLFRNLEDGPPVAGLRCEGNGQFTVPEKDQLPPFNALCSQENTVVFPIPGKTEVLGYVIVDREQQISQEERILMDGLLRVYHNFLNLLEESQKDQLTGLFNRRVFETKFQSLLVEIMNNNSGMEPSNRKAMNRDDHVWLALIDIDNFKNINDTFGHLYGDEVLILVSRFMAGAFRENDFVFRFGGEEFAVLLQAPDKETALNTLDRLRRSLSNHSFPQVGQVTVSIGVTETSLSEPVVSIQVGKADSALYYAKRNGKNQVVFYEDLPRDEQSVEQGTADDIELF